MFGLSLDAWNNLLVIFLVIGATFALLAGGATYFVIQLQKEEARGASQKLVETNIKLETVRSQNLHLEAKVAPRRLSDTEENQLIEALRPFAGKHILIRSYALDVDSALLGKQFLEVFHSAGMLFFDGRMTESAMGAMVIAIHVSGKDEKLGIALAQAIHEHTDLDVVFDEGPVRRAFTGIAIGNLPKGSDNADAEIFIGPKPID